MAGTNWYDTGFSEAAAPAQQPAQAPATAQPGKIDWTAIARGALPAAQDTFYDAGFYGDPNNPYRDAAMAAGTNEHGGSYDPFAAYDWARTDPYLDSAARGALYEDASAGTSQVRNPYDYVIGRDRDYVANMAAQQQAIAAQAQEQLGGIASGVATNTANNAAVLQGLGIQSADYGMNQASALSGGGAGLASAAQKAAAAINTGGNQLYQAGQLAFNAGDAAQGRNAYNLDFAQQGYTLGGALGYADRLGSMEQGPSAAQAQLQAGANQSMAQSLALARSGRGFGGSALGQSQALQQNAATMQNVANQSAILRAQEDQAWRAQQSQNLAQAAGIYQGAAGQFGQQQALGAQTALQNAQQNDAYMAQMYGLGLQGKQAGVNANVNAGQLALAGGQAGLGAQQNAATLGLQGLNQGANLYGQAATLQNQGAQLQGGLIGQGSQAASQGGLNAFGFNAEQNKTDQSRENMISQDYATRKGIGIQQQGLNNQETGSYIQAVGTGLGVLAMAASDERVKKGIEPASTDLRDVRGYSYEYADPSFGQGRFTGPMTADLKRNPATAPAVVTGPDGIERVDDRRLSLANTSAIADTQRELASLKAMIAASQRRKGQS